MNEIVDNTTRDLQEGAGSNAADLIETVLEATHSMTAPQAAVAIAGLGTFSVGVCYVVHMLSSLVKDGYIESLDFECKKINFNQPDQALGI